MLIFGGIGGGRFGVVILPFAALIIGYLADRMIGWFDSGSKKKAVITILVLLGIWECFYAIQSQLAIKPFVNSRSFLSADLPSYGGYGRLEEFVGDFYKDQKARPIINFYSEVLQLEKYQDKIIKEISKDRMQLPPYSHLLVYSDHLSWFPSVWIFERRRLYEAVPVMLLSEFLKPFQRNETDFYKNFGLSSVTVIIPTENVRQDGSINNEQNVENFVAELKKNVKPSVEIRGADNRVLFEVFSLPL